MIPISLLIKYRDVQNIINAKMNRLARKHANVHISVNLWIDYLKEKKYEAGYVQHEGDEAPFLIYWMSDWQKMVS